MVRLGVVAEVRLREVVATHFGFFLFCFVFYLFIYLSINKSASNTSYTLIALFITI